MNNILSVYRQQQVPLYIAQLFGIKDNISYMGFLRSCLRFINQFDHGMSMNSARLSSLPVATIDEPEKTNSVGSMWITDEDETANTRSLYRRLISSLYGTLTIAPSRQIQSAGLRTGSMEREVVASDGQLNEQSNFNFNPISPLPFYFCRSPRYTVIPPKPRFYFDRETEQRFDLLHDNFGTLCSLITIFPGHKFYFSVYKGASFAVGEGSNRQIYQRLMSELITKGILVSDSYFIDVNSSNPFWSDPDNIRFFVVFVAMLINYQCLLAGHFTPVLLECITYKKLSMDDLVFYMELIDPQTLKVASKYDAENFSLMESDFDTHYDLYRHIVCGSIGDDKLAVYRSIAKNFEAFGSFNRFDIQVMDKTFSGAYVITPEMVLPLFLVDDIYQDQWSTFVKSLTSEEIKRMMLTFTNSLVLQNTIHVYISRTTELDIKVRVCSREVYINVKLFEDDTALYKLKDYFTSDDEIFDGMELDNDRMFDQRFDDGFNGNSSQWYQFDGFNGNSSRWYQFEGGQWLDFDPVSEIAGRDRIRFNYGSYETVTEEILPVITRPLMNPVEPQPFLDLALIIPAPVSIPAPVCTPIIQRQQRRNIQINNNRRNNPNVMRRQSQRMVPRGHRRAHR